MATTPRTGVPDSRRLAIAVAAMCLLSAYPLASVVGPNLGVVPLGASVVVRILLIGGAIALVPYVGLRRLIPDGIARASWLCCVLLLMGGYGFALRMLNASGLGLEPGEGLVAGFYTAAALMIASLAVKPWKNKRRDPVAWLITALALVGVNAYQGVARLATSGTPTGTAVSEEAVQTTDPDSQERLAQADSPDVYYVILDGFGRLDVLRERYGADLEALTAFLAANGFYVPSLARSNYAQTFLSVASVLNLTYLDQVAADTGQDSSNRSPLAALIQRGRLMQLAREAGYEVVGIGSDYMATERLSAADECICDPHGLDAVERAVLNLTPLGALPVGRRAFDAHRQNVLEAFEALEAPRDSTQPRFTFAHIVAPHPPFLFDAQGLPRRPPWPFGFEDGNHYRGSRAEYIEGYRDQVEFIASRVIPWLEVILARPGPPPVVIIHGDHGPGADLHWEDPEATDMAERMSIFAAYGMPGRLESLYPTLTPLNGARALASAYFGAALPTLEDRSWFSTWSRPYDFIALPAEEQGIR